MKKSDQAALVAFSHAVQLGATLTTDVAVGAVCACRRGEHGQTALVDGTYAGIMVGESDAGRALLIVFSDGVDTVELAARRAVLDAAKRADVVVYGVSVVSRLKPEFLRDITSFTGGRLFEIEKTANLAATFLGILDEFRHRYLVSYTPQGRGEGRLAQTRRARQESPGDDQGAAGLSRRLVAVRSAINRGLNLAQLRVMRTELESLYRMIEKLDTAMMTTRRPDGHLESRAMANQKHASGADLWFVTSEATAKLRDLEFDPKVNLGYYNPSTKEWISVSGVARASRDRQKIHELYMPDWSMWFPKEGDSRHGTADDPRMVLIGVDVHAAVYLEVNKPKPVVLYELVKGWLTGAEPKLGEMHEVGKP